ncbi:MAG: RluA family pseudouridine synthase [Candidatus Ancaeobacter aquaticus]|nr:RluA family pseudouridine synthase [Candidatus Ancaeobacter aquaticus]
MTENIRLTIDEEEENERIDKYIASFLEGQSRSYIQKLIKNGDVLINGKCVKPNCHTKNKDEIEIHIPDPVILDVVPENIPITVLYEDDSYIVLNKSAGMVVHPASGNFAGTLVNALLYHTENLSDINGVLRPGIVHRLDKDTTGCLVVAKTNHSHRNLSKQFETRLVKKEYCAIVKGVIKEDNGVIDIGIARHPVMRKKMKAAEYGRQAVSVYGVIERFKDATYVRVYPKTGRTHQIRVHLSHIGYPILGDDLYCRNSVIRHTCAISRQMLHAERLQFFHPDTAEFKEYVAPLPSDMKEAIACLRKLE